MPSHVSIFKQKLGAQTGLAESRHNKNTNFALINQTCQARINSRQCLVYASLFAHIDYEPLTAYCKEHDTVAQ